MESPKVENFVESLAEIESSPSCNDSVGMEAEIPEVLYRIMKEFLQSNPKLDQQMMISSALANFLFQNGCKDRSVTEKYLNDLFNL